MRREDQFCIVAQGGLSIRLLLEAQPNRKRKLATAKTPGLRRL
jgi:hypothetical protein